MKLQTIFNRVKNHMLKQNKKSKNAGGCAYRGDKRTKCAVGCLIKNKYYSEILEGRSIQSVAVMVAVQKSLSLRNVNDPLEYMLFELQTIHDKAPAKDWKMKIDELEKRDSANYDLSSSVY